MKNFIVRMTSLLIVLSICLAALCSCEQAPKEPERPELPANAIAPIAYFSFDRLSESGAFVEEMENKECVSYGNPTIVDGKNDKALSLSDSRSSLSLETELPTGNKEHTIAAWVKPGTETSSAVGDCIVAGWGEYSSLRNTLLMLYQNQFCATSHDIAAVYPIPKDADNTWYHIALSYDGLSYKLYVNGMFVAFCDTNRIDIQDTVLYIGGMSSIGGIKLGYLGLIDDLYVFDKALTRGQIVECMDNEIVYKEENRRQVRTMFDIDSSELHSGWNSFIYSGDSANVDFDIFIPDSYEKGGATEYPLMTYLCGDGGNNVPPERIMLGEGAVVRRTLVEAEDCIIIVPTPVRSWLTEPADRVVSWPRRSYNMADAVPSADLTAVLALIDDCINKLPVDDTRVYLAGYSRGTMASWYILTNYPDKFAAATICCGSGDPNAVDKFKDVPIWLFSGDADPLVSFEDLRDIYNAYEAAGGEGRFTQCQGGEHDILRWIFDEEELITWLFSKHK